MMVAVSVQGDIALALVLTILGGALAMWWIGSREPALPKKLNGSDWEWRLFVIALAVIFAFTVALFVWAFSSNS